MLMALERRAQKLTKPDRGPCDPKKMSGGQEKHRSCETGAVKEDDQGQAKMDALPGSTHKCVKGFKNIEIKAEL